MLIRPTEEELANFGEPDFIIYNAGQFPANRFTKGMSSATSVEINFKRMEMVILGTEYAGEMKKGVFSVMVSEPSAASECSELKIDALLSHSITSSPSSLVSSHYIRLQTWASTREMSHSSLACRERERQRSVLTRGAFSSVMTSMSGPTLVSSTLRAAVMPSASTSPPRRSPRSTTRSVLVASLRTSSTTPHRERPTMTMSALRRTRAAHILLNSSRTRIYLALSTANPATLSCLPATRSVCCRR